MGIVGKGCEMVRILKLLGVLTIALLMMGCSNELIDIEDANAYSWQKYMSTEEFDKIENGMSYIDVVKIAGGSGKEQAKKKENNIQIYKWEDEILVTKAYEVEFEKNKVISKKVIDKQSESK